MAANLESGPVAGSFLDPAVLSDPYPFYAQLREHAPVYRMPETDIFLLTRYEDVRFALKRPDLFSNRPTGGASLQREKENPHQRILRERGWGHVEILQRSDPPEHARGRNLVNRVFTKGRVREMVDHIDRVTHALIDTWIGRGECDFVSEFAMPMPGIIIAEQLGLPASEIHTFKRWADAMLAPAMRPLSSEEIVDVAEIELEAQHYLAGVFEDRRSNPRDDLISALVHAHVGEDGEAALSVHELQNLMHQLITGGFETTMSAIAHGVWQWIRFPEVVQRLRADRSLIQPFCEESLRFESPVQGLGRYTTRDFEMHGVVMPKGSMVSARYGAANRDPAKFLEPDRLDLGRPNTGQHLAFGLGTHFCIGASLARQEMASAFGAVLDRLDHIELAEPLPEPAHELSFFLAPLKRLPIRFAARA